MGSYLSIVNNTPDEWLCRIGPDEKALKIAGIIVTALGTLAAVIATLGAVAPLTAAIGATAITVMGVSGTALKLIGATSTFAVGITKGVTDDLVSKGFTYLPAGDKMRSKKLTLSLWQQGTCVRTYAVNERVVRTETLYMRPIFTGATADSNRDHDIQWWINKHGVETKDVMAKPGPAPAPRDGSNNNNNSTRPGQDSHNSSSIDDHANHESNRKDAQDHGGDDDDDNNDQASTGSAKEDHYLHDEKQDTQRDDGIQKNNEPKTQKVHPEAHEPIDSEQATSFDPLEQATEQNHEPNQATLDTVADQSLSFGTLIGSDARLLEETESDQAIKVFRAGETDFGDLELVAGDTVVIYGPRQ